MAVRHEVENLVRRGNIFYWRARVPIAFMRCGKDTRLSLSLQASDHRKAQYLARRLNTLLAELKFGPKAAMSTKEQLARLFTDERDRMIDHLEDVALMSRHQGRPDDIADVEMDIENGWAYRLLEKFGTRMGLTFETGCPGRAMLLKQSVPDAHIANIQANYSAERALSQGRAFENSIRRLMADFDIEDNAINRERATMSYFRARADALMEVDDRYPLADRNLSILTGGTAAKVPQSGAVIAIAVKENHEPRSVTDLEPGHSAAVIVPDPTAPPEQSTLEVPDTSQTQSVAAPAAKHLPVSSFFETCEKMVANKGDEWEPATANDARALVRVFTGILEEHGVTHSGEITQFHTGELRLHFNNIPTRWGQSTRLRALKTADLREEGRKMREMAERSGTKANVGLNALTVRKHLGNLEHFLRHLRGHGYSVLAWTLEGVRPRKPKAGTVRHQQFKPKPEDVLPIFSSPIFTGWADEDSPALPGKTVFHGSLYYLPILFTYLGARRKEFAGLSVDDIYQNEDGDGWVIHIRRNELRRIKNVQSDRILPLPSEMIRLGFLEYRDAIKALGYKALFPDLFSPYTENDPGDRFYDEFQGVMKATLGEALWDRSLHALRHGLANTLKQRGVPPAIIDDISGRLSEGETNTRYTNPAEIPLMKDALAKFPIVTKELQAHRLQLLPWVKEKLPAPWARAGRKQSD